MSMQTGPFCGIPGEPHGYPAHSVSPYAISPAQTCAACQTRPIQFFSLPNLFAEGCGFTQITSLQRVLPVISRNSTGKRTPGLGQQIALDIARGLQFLHERHIVHLDLKSPNGVHYGCLIQDLSDCQFNGCNVVCRLLFVQASSLLKCVNVQCCLRRTMKPRSVTLGKPRRCILCASIFIRSMCMLEVLML